MGIVHSTAEQSKAKKGKCMQVAAYEFTTLTCIPGVVHYRGAKIQMLDLPGIIEGAKDGKGRGRQVCTTVLCDAYCTRRSIFVLAATGVVENIYCYSRACYSMSPMPALTPFSRLSLTLLGVQHRTASGGCVSRWRLPELLLMFCY